MEKLLVLGGNWALSTSAGGGWMLRRDGRRSFWLRTDPDNWANSGFIKQVAQSLAPYALVLDAGAGHSPYRAYFSRQRLHSCDIRPYRGITFIGALEQLPLRDKSFDAVICTQVLEHVPNPMMVLDELFRVLKAEGSLYMTVPFVFWLHGEPYNYFNFSKYALEHLGKDTGFEVMEIRPKGGIFWFFSRRLRTTVGYFLGQYNGISRIVLYLLYIVSCPLLIYVIPLMLFYVDRLDKDKGCTLGYTRILRRPV